MIGKILAGIAGARAGRNTEVGGAGGALLGIAGASLFRRLSLPALLAVTAGGYALKKWSDQREAEPAPAPKKSARKPRQATAKPA